MAEATGFGAGELEVMPDLYSFDYDDVMLTLRKLDERWQAVAVVGHNPAITDLVNFLALEHLANIPTCGIALLRLDIRRWEALGAGTGTLEHYDFPSNETAGDE
jgi:phosphohistidine phosphatase